jgi:LuxR family transcriptional regulator, quorum-sensing system regulator RaiR
MSAIELIEPVRIDGCAIRLTDTILGYNEKDLSETLKEVASEIGVCHISYIRFAQDKSADTSIFTASTTYSKEWLARYFLKKYVNTDPVIAYGRNAVVPFDWETLGNDEPAAAAFLADATNHGVGRHGLSIPVRNRRGVFSLVSFTSDRSKAEWEQYKVENSAKLHLLAVLIDSAANINFKLPSPPIKLSRREEQCLIWAARGKTYQEIGEILELTFGSVKTHLDSARHKLNCMNLVHTVAVAIATAVLPAKAVQGDIREN